MDTVCASWCVGRPVYFRVFRLFCLVTCADFKGSVILLFDATSLVAERRCTIWIYICIIYIFQKTAYNNSGYIHTLQL